MSEQKNTITINGSRYEIGGFTPLVSGAKSAVKNIDGVFQKKSHHKNGAVHHKSTAKHHKPAETPRKRTANKTQRKPQHAKTLMRSTVAKPTFASPSKASSIIVKTKTLKSAVKSVDHQINIGHNRQKRAEEISRSRMISRFGQPQGHVVVKRTEKISVKETPAEEIKPHHESPITESIEAIVQPISSAEQLFTDALNNATSHLEPATKHSKKHRRGKHSTKRKVANAAAVFAVVVALGGFIYYQNSANIAMRVASSKAGIHGTLPSYKPSGFAMNKDVQSEPGKVVVSYNSTTDSRNFAISQSASDWNSETLYDSFVASTGQPYEKIDTSTGKSVYVYGDSSATWVDGGIWYKVEGNSGLNSNQLVQLANSL